MTGIILAGGESSRMGSNKAFLMLQGRPLVGHILAVFLRLFEQTVIVTNEPERYADFRVRVVRDVLDVRGPLTGIYTGLLHARSDHIFVAACDMPFLNARLIAYMQEVAGQFDAVAPAVNGLSEPLHAIYHRRTLPVLRELIVSGERRASRFLDTIRVRFLTDTEIVHYDPQRLSFKNLNTPEDYKEAVCSDSACRNC
jgi:molybdopterin-guanine dinucleotide biosynthesis protein A